MNEITLKVFGARRQPDPTFPGAFEHSFWINVQDLSHHIPTNPNPRRPAKTLKSVYLDVTDSLLNKDIIDPKLANCFHVKNKGMLIFANSVDRDSERTDKGHKSGSLKEEEAYLRISFREEEGDFVGDGNMDGGHTYEIIKRTANEIQKLNSEPEDGYWTPIKQYVKVSVLQGYPKEIISHIAQARNTGIQVTQESLLNLEGAFDWIKEALKDEPYNDKIGYFQGDTDENEQATQFDVRDIVSLLELFNLNTYPKETPSLQPTDVYHQKAQILERYGADTSDLQKMLPILKDVLRLHDVVTKSAAEWAAKNGFELKNGIVKRRKTPYTFMFSGEQGVVRLHNAPLYALLSAFRGKVRRNDLGVVVW
ncbi:MAG TPA: AIPR family protein, partial [Fimbriimonadaceae bacterium]